MIRITITTLSLFLNFVLCRAETPARPEEAADSLSRQLQEVVVTANIPGTRLSGNTIVSVIAGSPLQNVGTAADVLAQLPMITVSDGEVAVVGKGVPEIYIDGRPMRDGDELSRLQSDNIRKVELDLAPGAMYDGDTRAVVRISTRRDFISGLSLTDRAMVEKRRHWSANNMLDLNYRFGKWDIFASGLVGHYDTEIRGVTTNTLLYDGKIAEVGSTQANRTPSTVGVVKAGFNYAGGERSLGASYRYNPEHGTLTNSGAEWIDRETPVARRIERTTNAGSHLVSVYYDETFGEAYRLHFDGDCKLADSNNEVSTLYPGGESPDVRSFEDRQSSLWAGKLYLALPLWSGRLTVGSQDSYSRSRLDYRMSNPGVEEYIPSSLTEASQVSASLFSTWSRDFGKLSLSAGLRYEYVDYVFRMNNVKMKELSRTDHLLTPDISLGYVFNDRAQVGISYRLSTVKPPYSQLTGSLNYVGRHEIEGGNPSLRDERMHTLQLSGMWNGFILQAGVERSLDTYGFVKRLYPAPALQLLLQPINIDLTSLDAYLVWEGRVGCWSPSVTAGVHKQWLGIGDTRYDKPILSYFLDNVVSLPYGFMLTVNLRGQSSGDFHTNRFGAGWFVADASVSKSFLGDSLRVKLAANDIFNTSNNDWTMDTYGVFVNKMQSYDRRGVSLSLTYRLHPRKSRYKGEAASEAELNRF